MRVLYIENEPSEANLIERYFHACNHQVTLVNSLEEARFAVAVGYDLILIDIWLGHAEQGYAFVRELRNRGYTAPVIAITGLAYANDIVKCFEVGCSEVLTKPFTLTQFVEVINPYLARA